MVLFLQLSLSSCVVRKLVQVTPACITLTDNDKVTQGFVFNSCLLYHSAISLSHDLCIPFDYMQPLDEAFILGNKFKLNWDATGDECTHLCVATAMPHTGSIESTIAN